MTEHDRILILDFCLQYTQLIARRIREERVYSKVHPPTRSLEWIREWAPHGIILSGGPASAYDEGVPKADPGLLELGVPVLGTCYGLHLLAEMERAQVVVGKREYGRAELTVHDQGELFEGFKEADPTQVWCSHGDHVEAPSPGYHTSVHRDAFSRRMQA